VTVPLLDARGLCASFGARPVLDAVDLAVRPGELWAVLGPNGAGKSTLLRVLLGLHPMAAGTLRVFGRPLPEWSRRALAQKVAWVPQQFEPAFGFTGLELVAMGRSPHLSAFGLPSSADLAAARAALSSLGVSHLADRGAQQMSGGEMRLLVLARALVQAPELLLLDEPTAFLDLRHQVECLRLVRERTCAGLGALAVLHDVNLAAAFADQVLLLREGRVVAFGPPSSTLSAAVLETLYGIPMQVGRAEGGQSLFAPRTGAGA
jgi:iron complex transport system ATP-binding protein